MSVGLCVLSVPRRLESGALLHWEPHKGGATACWVAYLTSTWVRDQVKRLRGGSGVPSQTSQIPCHFSLGNRSLFPASVWGGLVVAVVSFSSEISYWFNFCPEGIRIMKLRQYFPSMYLVPSIRLFRKKYTVVRLHDFHPHGLCRLMRNTNIERKWTATQGYQLLYEKNSLDAVNEGKIQKGGRQKCYTKGIANFNLA